MATADAFPFERDLTKFDRTVRAAQREIMLHVRLAIREGNLQRRDQQLLQLSRVLAVLDQLGAYTDPAARQMVQDAYDQGAARALAQIAGLSITAPEIPGAFAGVSLDAIRVLQDAINGNLDDSRRRIGRQVQDVYARAGRTAATRAILGIDGSPVTARRALVRDLLQDRQISRMVQNGGPGFVDTAGRKWTLDRYASMAVRTVTREAVVQGAVDRMVAHQITLARITTHEGACEICKPYIGRLVDLTGSTRDFDGEAVMSGPLPPYHPNCRCTASPVAVRVERVRREMQAAGLV